MKRPEFVSFGSRTRIKLSNIVAYGIETGVDEPETSDCFVINGKVFRPHLWVETYQKRISHFFQDEVDFDIYDKLPEIDEYFK